VRALSELGYRNLSVPMLIALRNHGVDPDDVRGFKEAGYGDLSAGLLVEMRNHGVTAEFAEEMKEAVGRHLQPAELIELRVHGVARSWCAGCATGHPPRSPEGRSSPAGTTDARVAS
jgi:hypothetical protein